MSSGQPPPPYSSNSYYPPQHPNEMQGKVGEAPVGMIPSVDERINMGIPDSAPPEYNPGFDNLNCFSDAVIRRGSTQQKQCSGQRVQQL
ncbi:hypothetical protein E1301_Tti006922 [Triplophysa tibetana]|uniref:Uncharacterized protein n=1 Tax=Triplophysa tibetana TaxID=1572043 RepID=A0A5A9N2N3_9TELE|nr:hypothetical protein E1301_Tti006922 [Triplophysa tibetana]